MKVSPVKTGIIEARSADITEVLAGSLDSVPECSVVAITSKIVSLCEGSVVDGETCDMDRLVEKEADLFLPKGGKYGVYLTIKDSVLVANAGIDQSNAGGYCVLWPRDPQESANRCWQYLRWRFGVKKLGVIITDSVSAPLKWGVTGTCIAHCGFSALNSMVGKRDIFGRELRMTKVNIAGGLAAAAALCMGEGGERTPIALIEEPPFVNFCDAPPAGDELEAIKIDMEDDLYSQLLSPAPWRPGKK